MLQPINTWFRSQFVQSHTRRDVDLDHWWQLPDDPTRTRSPWLQLVVDLVAPSTFSEWHEKVAESRVKDYDKLRPPVTRLVFLLSILAVLWALRAPWSSWAMTAPAMAQVILEIHLHRYLADSAPEPRWRLVRRMRDMVSKHFQTMLLNVTGILGIAACPLNVIAVCLTPVGDADGWVKIAGLAAAIFYLNSGLASALLDPPNYTEISVMPPVMHWIRPYAPLISYIVVTAIVWGTDIRRLWPPDLAALAYLCAGLTLLLGGTIRNHDRMVAAAAPVAREAVQDGRSELGGVVHDDLGPAKAAAENASRIDGVPLKDAVELQALSAFLTHFKTRIGIYAAQRMELSDLVRKIIAPYGISPREVTYDIRWDTKTIRKEDHKVAIRMATALVHNVGQALQRYPDVPKCFAVEGYVTGEGRDVRYHLAVRDHLPALTADELSAGGGTLAAIRDWLREDFNGDLAQDVVGDGTKRIIASWSDRPPITGYGDTLQGKGPT